MSTSRIAYYEITSACPCMCAHCPVLEDLRHEKPVTRTLPDITVDFCILGKLGVKSIVLSGGEPTVYPEINEVVLLASKMFEKVAVISNAVFPLKLQPLSLLSKIWVSLDYFGSKQDEWRQWTGLWSNYRSIEDIANVRTTLLRDNLEDVKKLIAYASRNNRETTVVPYRGDDPQFMATSKQMVNLLHYIFTNGFGEQAVIDDPSVRMWLATRDRQIMEQAKEKKSLCTACETVIRINPHGEVHPCPFLPDIIGDLRDNRIEQRIVAARQKLINTYSGKCQGCAHNKVCGGCRASPNDHCFCFTEKERVLVLPSHGTR